jgi:predicted RNase H-like nuclease (RuvC/YqgF family)
MSYGNTVLVATDVSHVPKAVRKLATTLNANIFYPNKEIPISVKNDLVNKYLNDDNFINFHKNAPENAHQRDSS